MKFRDYVCADQFRFYYSLMNSEEQKAYNEMLEGLCAFSEHIKITAKVNVDNIDEIYHKLKRDVPELFFVDTVTFSYILRTGACTEVKPKYRFDEKTSTDMMLAIEQRYGDFIASLRGLSDYEKELAIHDRIATQVTYADKDKPYSHEAPGALLYDIGVCEGMSKAFKFLADRVGLKSIVVFGDSDGSAGRAAHAWNVVHVDGTFYHLDVTYDASSGRKPGYGYFNLSDKEISANHSWTDHLPECDAPFMYYKRKGVFFEKRSELEKYIKRIAKCGGSFEFQIPKLNASEESILNAIAECLSRSLTEKLGGGHSYSYTYNLNRMIFNVKCE